MIEATLDRYAYLNSGTAGVLTIKGRSFVTVERPWKDNQRSISCIPEGIYQVKPYSSARFPDTWEIKNVPNRTYILLHAGNTPTDVEGCIAIGMDEGDRDPLWVHNSKQAMKELRSLVTGGFELIIRPYSTKNKRGYL